MWGSALRCILILTLSLLAVPLAAEAQQPGKVYRIGILAGSVQEVREQRGHEALQQGWRRNSSVATLTSSLRSLTRWFWLPSRRPPRSPL
jgi:hypothetical protein